MQIRTLSDYAEAHGVPMEAYINAGYKETLYSGLKALSFPTDGGLRYRMLEGNSKYIGKSNQVWYRLREALALVKASDSPLIITNGEASVVAAQHYGLPATAVTMGEKTSIPEMLVDELKTAYNGAIILAFDSDKAGVNASKGISAQLKEHGYSVIPVNFNKDNGYDLADWLKDNQPVAVHDLVAKNELYTFDVPKVEIIEKEQVQNTELEAIIEAINDNFPWIEYVESHLGETEAHGKGEYKVLGMGNGFFINPEKGLWQAFAENDTQRGNVVHIVQRVMYADNYNKDDKQQFANALKEAASIAKVRLPERKSTLATLTERKTVEGEVITLPQHSGRLSSIEYVNLLQFLGFTFRLNDLTDTVEVNGKPITDVIRAVIDTKMADMGLYHRVEIENAYIAYAYENRYNPIKEYLETLQWDGVARIEHLASHLHEDGEKVAPIFLKRWMIGAVAKVLDRKQNMMLVLSGAQNGGKSTFARWICPLSDYFLESPINPDDKDDQIRLMSKFVWEVGELGSTTRKADVEALKAFITRDMVQVRKSYGKYDTVKPATASMIGTVNDDGAGFLVDTTGNRRFMVIAIESIDFSYTDLDINQLWAEAVALYRNGESYRLTPDELALQTRINSQFEVADPMEDVINEHYIADPKGFVLASELLDKVKENGSFGATDKAVSMALSKTLTKMGYKKHSNGKERGWLGLKAKGFKSGLR